MLFGPAHIGTKKTSTRPNLEKKDKKRRHSHIRPEVQANLHIPLSPPRLPPLGQEQKYIGRTKQSEQDGNRWQSGERTRVTSHVSRVAQPPYWSLTDPRLASFGNCPGEHG